MFVGDKSHPPHFICLLCARRERPCRHAPEKSNELATPHYFPTSGEDIVAIKLAHSEGTGIAEAQDITRAPDDARFGS
jgi:hypothetical protein